MDISNINPELRKSFSRMPHLRFDKPWVLRLIRFLTGLQRGEKSAGGVTIQDRQLPGAGVRVYAPQGEKSGAALLWIHGGGLIMGSNLMNDRECIHYARQMGLVVVSVEYRLAPEYPFPAPLDDCYEAWQWLQAAAEELGVDPHRVAISGQSAGGGLAAALVQRIHDVGGVQPAAQALFCPMLDDRTAVRQDLDAARHKMWNNTSNRAGWSHYLGHPAGEEEHRRYAVPARREDLSGLPDAWIGIGSADLFLEESQAYRDRLLATGTACEFHTAPGGYHGFEGVAPQAEVTRAMRQSNERFLRRTLGLQELASYKRVTLTSFGGPECLQLQTVDGLPEPAAGEVRVKVITAGTGFTDTIVRQGQYVGVKEKPPFTPGYDWFGAVDKLGPDVQGLEIGQFVADMPVFGGYTQYLCVAADRVVPAPKGLDPAQAVAMILSYTTAYQMLTRIRTLQPGATCLVHAAGGAVGTALLELGRELGLEMYGTASKGKHDLVRSFGATPIDYRNEDFVTRILKETGGKGVDAVFDTIGGKNWSRSYRCVKRGGILIAFGALQLTTGEERVPSLLWGFCKLLLGWRLIPDGRATAFYNIQTRREKEPGQFKEDVAALFGMLKDGKLKPALQDVVPLERVAEVHRMIDSAQIAGKIVLRVSGS